jgi:hypothetical protein
MVVISDIGEVWMSIAVQQLRQSAHLAMEKTRNHWMPPSLIVEWALPRELQGSS